MENESTKYNQDEHKKEKNVKGIGLFKSVRFKESKRETNTNKTGNKTKQNKNKTKTKQKKDKDKNKKQINKQMIIVINRPNN